MTSSCANIVVLGAGYGGITAALRLERKFRKLPQYQVNLVDINPFHTIKTQLHEAAIRKASVTIPIDRILKNKRILFHLGEVKKINSKEQTVLIGTKLINFDYLVVAIGSKVNYYSIPGMKEFSFSLQTLKDAETIYVHISKICASAASETEIEKRKEMLRFVIGGGGLSGVEFAGELSDHISKCIQNFNIPPNDSEIILIEASNYLVPSMGNDFSSKINKQLVEKGLRIITGTKITNRTQKTVTLSTNESINTRTLIWTGGIRVSNLLQEGGMKAGQSGRIIVDEFLRTSGFPNIYAIGDDSLALNFTTGKPVPAAAQFALQQGRLVADNIYSDVSGKEKAAYQPKVMGEVVSLGRHLAIGWLALPFIKKVTFIGFLGRLLKAAISEKHILLLRKESRNWISQT